MNWLNIRLVTLRSAEYVGSDPIARATWWNVVAYSAEQENGGRIVGAKRWKDRQWQQTCGVTLEEVNAAALLLTWQGDDLLVWSYPSEKEEEIRAKREAGKVGGSRSVQARTKHTLTDKRSLALSRASSSASTEGEGEGKENRKEKENDPFASLPGELDSTEFREAWSAYVAYRKRRKIAPLLPESVAMQWKKMKGWGVVLAILQIEETISQNWQGVFAPKAGTAKPRDTEPARSTIVYTPEAFTTPQQILANAKAERDLEERRAAGEKC